MWFKTSAIAGVAILLLTGCGASNDGPVEQGEPTQNSTNEKLPVLAGPWKKLPNNKFKYTMNDKPAVLAVYTTQTNSKEACQALATGLKNYGVAQNIKPKKDEMFLESIELAVEDEQEFMKECEKPLDESFSSFGGTGGKVGDQYILANKKALLVQDTLLKDMYFESGWYADETSWSSSSMPGTQNASSLGNPNDIAVIFIGEK